MDSPLPPGGAVLGGTSQVAPELLSPTEASFAAGAAAPAAYAAYPGAAGTGGPLAVPPHMLVGGSGEVSCWGMAPPPCRSTQNSMSVDMI